MAESDFTTAWNEALLKKEALLGRSRHTCRRRARLGPPKSSLTETNDLLLRDLARGRVRAPGSISGEGCEWSLMS
jgi:hypothetical protein